MNVTDICNLALSYISKERINSLNDNSEEAKECKIHYDHCRRRLLLAYSFGFAKSVHKLAELEPERYKIPGWSHLYAYPESTLAVHYVYDEEHAGNKEDCRMEYEIIMNGEFDRVIATNVENAYAECIHDVKEPDIFSEEFIDALAHMLAASIAFPLTGSANIQQTQLQLAQMALEAAEYQSAIERERRTKFPRKYAESRFR